MGGCVVGLLWAATSLLLTFLSGFTVASSTWVLQFPDSDQNGFGPLKSCHFRVEPDLHFVQKCSYFILGTTSHGDHVASWPNSPFQVTALLYCVGTLFLSLASLFAAATLCPLPALCTHRLAWLAGYFQLSAGNTSFFHILFTVSLKNSF